MPGPPQGTSAEPPRPRRRRDRAGGDSRATLALVLGLVSLFCLGPLVGVPAVLVGKAEMNAIKAGNAPPSGMPMAQWGFYLGIAGTVLSIAGCLVFTLVHNVPGFLR